MTRLLIKAFGCLVCLAALAQAGRRGLWENLTTAPVSFSVTAYLCLLLALMAPRLMLLVPTAIAAWIFIVQVGNGDGGPIFTMRAVEYPLFAAIPTILAVILFASRQTAVQEPPNAGSIKENWDTVFSCCLRWLLLITLFLVFFSKLNTDYLIPETSCEGVLKNRIPKVWSGGFLPWLASLSNPTMILLLEGPFIICLLLFYRHMGILAVCFLFGFISLIDALVITFAMVVLALAFLNEEDLSSIRKRWKPWLGIWLMQAVPLLIASHALYRGARPWFVFAIHQSLFLLVIVFVAGCAWEQWKASGPQFLKPEMSKLRGFTKRGNWIVGAVAALWLFNGMTPYLGLKFEYSFSMLSNLRADDSRWNHLIVPRWVRLWRDPLVHLTQFSGYKNRMTKASPVKKSGLYPGVFSPAVFVERINNLPAASVGHIEIEYSCAGKKHVFSGSPQAEEFQVMLANLPKTGRWFQDELYLTGPQPCVH